MKEDKYTKIVYQSDPIGKEQIILYLTTFDLEAFERDETLEKIPIKRISKVIDIPEHIKFEIEFDKRWYIPESEEYTMQKHFPDDTIDGFIYALDKMQELEKGDSNE